MTMVDDHIENHSPRRESGSFVAHTEHPLGSWLLVLTKNEGLITNNNLTIVGPKFNDCAKVCTKRENNN